MFPFSDQMLIKHISKGSNYSAIKQSTEVMSQSVLKIHISRGKCNCDRKDDYIQQDEVTKGNKQENKFKHKINELKSKQE